MVWWLAFLLLFHYPIHSFKGWSLSDPSDAYLKLGLVRFFIKTMVFNTFLAVIVPQAAFTYVLLYWLMPHYFYKNRNPVITVCLIICLLVLFLFVFAGFRIMVGMGNYFFGLSKSLTGGLSFNGLMNVVPRDIMLTSLPIVAGFALMIKLMKRWWLKQKETEQLANEKTKAELQLLKAQIHPHFLFNTLNNIYFFTLSGSPKAPEMINKLSGLLHYIINECNQPLVPLQKEITMIYDYTALEKIRYGEQMAMTIDIQEDGTEKWIAPLLLIPFVENSFKHGASRMLTNPWVKLRISVENNMLHFLIMNSRPIDEEPQLTKGNIGLKNVKKRLQLLYPGAHELNIVSELESFAVYLKIRLESTKSAATKSGLKTTAVYEMA
jgi:sensor histidine kinase YesM